MSHDINLSNQTSVVKNALESRRPKVQDYLTKTDPKAGKLYYFDQLDLCQD